MGFQMIKPNLFTSSERDMKLNQHGDILQDLAGFVDFSSVALSVDKASPRP